MMKIYNNLTVDNLIKTEDFKSFKTEEKVEIIKKSDWFNDEFTEYQQVQILEGLEENVDVFIYSNPNFSGIQMEEIKLGLQDNLDVSMYAKLGFSGYQIRQIRLGLKNNLDVSIYSKIQF